jgi:hypothetical protein
LLLWLVLFPVKSIIAQISIYGSNMLEYQLGNLPQSEPKDQSSLYDQLNLALNYKSFGLQTRIEQYYPSFGTHNSYFDLSQVNFSYQSENLELEVGNMYRTLGRGLLLRNYEIPASIWETRGYRVRYAFYRDLLGASLKYYYKNLEITLLRGKVLDVALPPTIDNKSLRRPDLVEGIETSYRIKRQTIGIIAMHNANNSGVANYTSFYYNGNISDNISVYAEMANQLNSGSTIISFDENAGFAGYISINYSISDFGFSLEYKNYQNFSIGSGINDPPTLVKEHSYRLLNRSTHVPILTGESGYQAELYYHFGNESMLTLNTSLARNELNNDNIPVFNEYFAEYRFKLSEKTDMKVFGDYARDPFVNEEYRYAFGGSTDIEHSKLQSTIELEWQQIKRELLSKKESTNLYVAYTISKASKYSFSLITETSNDPVYLERNKEYNIYPSVNITYHPNNGNIVSLFVGKRRGGPACNSGVCYDVLDFQGAELRVLTRF